MSAGAATALAYRRGQLAFYRKWRPLWAPLLGWYLRVRGRDLGVPGEVRQGAS